MYAIGCQKLFRAYVYCYILPCLIFSYLMFILFLFGLCDIVVTFLERALASLSVDCVFSLYTSICNFKALSHSAACPLRWQGVV